MVLAVVGSLFFTAREIREANHFDYEPLREVAAEDIEEELIELRRASFASQDLREGMRAFAERRIPRWSGQ